MCVDPDGQAVDVPLGPEEAFVVVVFGWCVFQQLLDQQLITEEDDTKGRTAALPGDALNGRDEQRVEVQLVPVVSATSLKRILPSSPFPVTV